MISINKTRKKIKDFLRGHYINYKGFTTDRRILVIESDDWGAIRTPSKDVAEKLEKSGFNISASHYVQNDSLASEKDLKHLFEVLKRVKDFKGNYPVITANTVLANPDFDKIRASGFNEYHYEWFTDSLKNYSEHLNAFDLWKLGQSEGIFHPQLHGREHLQVQRWMRDLKMGNTASLAAFDLGYCGLDKAHSDQLISSYLPSFDYESIDELSFIEKSLRDAATKFKELFGYTSTSFVAPNYVWNDEIELILKSCGIEYIQSGRAQFLPKIEKNNKSHIRHFVGEKNSFGQIYLVRNCSFEPSSDYGENWVKKCMNEIQTAFFWKKPAIIESHRVNYIGFLNEDNRKGSLSQLEDLLKLVVNKWPNIEFMTSDQLGNLICGKHI